jgi:fructose-bisphosphate aldolase class II
MTLVSAATLLAAAHARGGGLAAVDVVTLEQGEGAVLGAEQADLPVMLQVSAATAHFHLGDPAPLAAALAALADTSLVDVALHLDHVSELDLLHRAADCGFTSVLFDPARQVPYDEAVLATADAVAWGHAHGLVVSAELGAVGPDGEREGAHDPEVRTDPQRAAGYVAATGADALAVAVGARTGMTSATARLDLGLVRRLSAAVDVPLVLHGGSGVAQGEVTNAVEAGLTVITFGTVVSIAMARSVRQHLHDLPDVRDPRQYLTPARKAVSSVVAELVATVGLAGPAR